MKIEKVQNHFKYAHCAWRYVIHFVLFTCECGSVHLYSIFAKHSWGRTSLRMCVCVWPMTEMNKCMIRDEQEEEE